MEKFYQNVLIEDDMHNGTIRTKLVQVETESYPKPCSPPAGTRAAVCGKLHCNQTHDIETHGWNACWRLLYEKGKIIEHETH